MLFESKNKKAEKDDIAIIERTRPYMCGGTDAYRDTGAPKAIESKEMTHFDATTSLTTLALPPSEDIENRIFYISAFAVPCGGGSFLFLQESRGAYGRGKMDSSWAAVKCSIFPELVELVNETGLAKSNGLHSTTHGLPENFGGSVSIRYASGERISFSNNQCPIMSPEQVDRIDEVFTKAMAGERIGFPDVNGLVGIEFLEKREKGDYTKAVLTLNPDGTGTNRKTSVYDGRTYESEKPVEAEVVGAIKRTVESCGMLAWKDLPKNDYAPMLESTITFLFDGDEPITVDNGRSLPTQISGGFFNIELELSTKH